MGRDKALLPFRGGALAESVARVVELAAGSVAIVGRDELGSYRAIPDRYPGEGPLGGILTALEDSESYFNLIVACDMPEVTPGFLAGLLDAADDSDADVLIPIGPAGMPEPLCAVYHRRSLGALERAFRQGVRKVIEAAAEVEVVLLPIAEVIEFQNVNTPEDWSGYGAE
jgi:molybdenum cofactor guanylyltransferase